MQFDGILFDFGYTLAEYRLPDNDQSWKGLLKCSLDEIEKWLIRKNILDGPIDQLDEIADRTFYRPPVASHQEVALSQRLRLFFDELNLSLKPEWIDELSDVFYKPVNESVFVFKDSEPALKALRERGLKLGIVSNSPWGAPGAYGEMDVARSGLTNYFDLRIFSGDTDYRKPAPEIFQLALDKLNLKPNKTLFIGDDYRRDIIGAHSVGMKAVLRLYRPNEPGTGDYQINTCSEILDLL